MAKLIGLLTHLAVSWLLSKQTFTITLAFPRKESKAADRAAIKNEAFGCDLPCHALASMILLSPISCGGVRRHAESLFLNE